MLLSMNYVLIIIFKDHQWINIDMNDFIKYDWKYLAVLDLRGSGLSDKKWLLFVQYANKFPNLKELHLCNFLL